MIDDLDSNVMAISIDGTTIRYSFRDRGDVYELRNVPLADIAKLRLTRCNPSYSSSATVQLLTHRHKRLHFGPDGKPARPSRQNEGKLLPLTPFR